MNWQIVILIMILLIACDKALTIMNIKAVQKNFPNADAVSIEKNPLAKYLFEKTGLIWGTIIMSAVSLGLFLLIAFLFASSRNTIIYLFFLGYGFVIANNLYFFLKYNGVFI